jgi:hypothetical protein
MPQAKHTPGPWRFVPRTRSGDYPQAIIETGAKVVLDEGRGSQAIISLGFSDRDEANARLIAAAPDLLAVCEEIANDSGVDLVTSERRIRLYAAIAKAKGVA